MQEVIAAMTTAPLSIRAVTPVDGDCHATLSVGGRPAVTGEDPRVGRAERLTDGRQGRRSWGRRGPATLGVTSAQIELHQLIEPWLGCLVCSEQPLCLGVGLDEGDAFFGATGQPQIIECLRVDREE